MRPCRTSTVGECSITRSARRKRKVTYATSRFRRRMVVAPRSPPPRELSLPITAFCTTLLMMRSTTRSKALSWPSCRLPHRRKATRRNVYTATERSSFSAMLMSGTRMFMSASGSLPTASHRPRRFDVEFDTRTPPPEAGRHARSAPPGGFAGAVPRGAAHGRRGPVGGLRVGPELLRRRRRRLPAAPALRADVGAGRARPRVDARADRARDGPRVAPAAAPLPRRRARPFAGSALSIASSPRSARGRTAGRTVVDSRFEEDAHVRTGGSGADADPAHRAGAVRWIEDSRPGSVAGAGDPRVQEGRGDAGRDRRAEGGSAAPGGFRA